MSDTNSMQTLSWDWLPDAIKEENDTEIQEPEPLFCACMYILHKIK